VAFDLLRINGDDLRLRPIEARREALVRLIAKRRSDGVLFSEALAAEGAVVFARARELAAVGSAQSAQSPRQSDAPLGRRSNPNSATEDGKRLQSLFEGWLLDRGLTLVS